MEKNHARQTVRTQKLESLLFVQKYYSIINYQKFFGLFGMPIID